MFKEIPCNPEDLTYVDESLLQTGTEEEDFEDYYSMEVTLKSFADPEERDRYVAFLKRKGYDVPAE